MAGTIRVRAKDAGTEPTSKIVDDLFDLNFPGVLIQDVHVIPDLKEQVFEVIVSESFEPSFVLGVILRQLRLIEVDDFAGALR